MRPTPFLAVLLGCTPTVTQDTAVIAGDVLAVRIDVGAGHVSVLGGDRLEIGRTLTGSAAETAVQRVVDGILRVEVPCDTLLPCTAEITLTVPVGLPVDVRVGEGDVYLADLDQDLRVEVGDGDVRGEQLAGAARVQSGWGGAWLAFREPPRDLQVGVGVGDVFLSLPDVGYATEIQALAGQDVAVRRDEQGPRLQVRTASGRVSVQAAHADLAAR